MSPLGLVLFVGGVFGLRMLGGFGLGSLIGGSDRWTRLLALLPLAIVSAVVAAQVFTVRRSVVVDARAAGIAESGSHGSRPSGRVSGRRATSEPS